MNHQRLNTREAAKYLGLSEGTLEKLRIVGGGPEYFKPNRRVVYDRDALDAWLSGKRRRSTSDAGLHAADAKK
jgi:excisionase family DNA binding protein